MTPAERTKLEAHKAELRRLSANFAAHRCSRCGSAAVVSVRPGTDAIREAGMLLRRATNTRYFCLACLLRNNDAIPENDEARQGSCRAPDRRGGYHTPSMSRERPDEQDPAVPVDQTKGLGRQLQARRRSDVTGGPAVKAAAGFPGPRRPAA